MEFDKFLEKYKEKKEMFCKSFNTCSECPLFTERCDFEDDLLKYDLENIACAIDKWEKQTTEPEPNAKYKADAGKPRLSLVPMQILFDVARVREYGCNKYPDGGADNWKNVEPERYRDAMLRHMVAYIRDPGGVDDESGLPHRWHLECNLAFLAELEDMDEYTGSGEKYTAAVD